MDAQGVGKRDRFDILSLLCALSNKSNLYRFPRPAFPAKLTPGCQRFDDDLTIVPA